MARIFHLTNIFVANKSSFWSPGAAERKNYFAKKLWSGPTLLVKILLKTFKRWHKKKKWLPILGQPFPYYLFTKLAKPDIKITITR